MTIQDNEKAMQDKFDVHLNLISHDINNLVMPITTYMQLLLNKQDLPPEYRRFLETAKSQAEAITHLLSNAMLLSKIRPENISIETININNYILNAFTKINEQYSDKKIELITQYPEEPIFVLGDPILHSAFFNLLDNAVKYNDKDNIQIQINCSLSEDKKNWKIMISDNGPGIQEAIKEKILLRASGGIDTIHGSGLGLAIVRESILACKGRIEIEKNTTDTQSQGSTFIVFLPKDRGE